MKRKAVVNVTTDMACTNENNVFLEGLKLPNVAAETPVKR